MIIKAEETISPLSRLICSIIQPFLVTSRNAPPDVRKNGYVADWLIWDCFDIVTNLVEEEDSRETYIMVCN